MLKNLIRPRLLGLQHQRSFKESVRWLKNQKLSSILTIIVIAIALTLPGLFWIVSENLRHVLNPFQSNGHISLYLVDNGSSEFSEAVLKKVLQVEGVAKATLITPKEALKILEQQEGMQDVLRYLPDNPLPFVIDVVPSVTLTSPDAVTHLFHTLKTLPQVGEAKMDLEWVQHAHAIFKMLKKAAHLLMILLGLAILFIIANTLRLMIVHRQDEIEVLTWIGASDQFIRRPFLYAGLLLGLLGAILALVLIRLCLWVMAGSVGAIAATYQMNYTLVGFGLEMGFILIGVGASLGWLASSWAIRRQLRANFPLQF